MTTLREYRNSIGATLDQMAERFGISGASLSRIERGEQWPDREFFERLSEITAGEVTANDFVPSHNNEAAQ